MLWFLAEVSDQNFTDEEIKGEKASNICRSKKMKTEVSDASNHDQVMHKLELSAIIIILNS